MKKSLRLIATILAGLVVALGTGFVSYRIASDLRGAEIARIASVNVERSVRIRRAIDPKVIGNPGNLLDVAITQDLFYMESFESAAMTDGAYVRQRIRSVGLVKKEWLERPPFSLEDGTRAYVEKVCKESGNCPSGDMVSRPEGGVSAK